MTKKKNKKNSNKKPNSKPDLFFDNKTNKTVKSNKTRNTIIMKFLVFLGVVICLGISLYLMNYFFVERSYLKVNMSTDKKIDYINISGEKVAIATQKYVSDLNYNIRYDIDKFTVFKYKSQDIFKYSAAEKILVVVERGIAPESCGETKNDILNSCIVPVNDYTNEYYVTSNNKTYKITVKTPGENNEEVESRINYMIKSFEIV